MIHLNKTYTNRKGTLQEIRSINHNISNNCNTGAKRSNIKIKKLRKRLNIAQSKQSFIIKGRQMLYKYRQPIINTSAYLQNPMITMASSTQTDTVPNVYSNPIIKTALCLTVFKDGKRLRP